MKKTITIDFQDRLENIKTLLTALRKCRGIEEYIVIAQIETDNPEAIALAHAIKFAKVKVFKSTKNIGENVSMYEAFENAFQLCDFNIHIGEKMMPTYDCLTYMEHCCIAYRDDASVFSISAFNSLACKAFQSGHISRRSPYMQGIFGLWRNRWEWISARCLNKGAIPLTHLNNNLKKFELSEIYPLLSRSRYIENSLNWQKSNSPVKKPFYASDAIGSLPIKTFFEAGPLVTAVMITGMHTKRYDLARISIECFKKQTYPNKELLIINHGCESLTTGDCRIRELRITKSRSETVGDLRNLGLKYALGEFIINWDDDDWHHPHRIEKQMAAQKGDAAVFLKHRINYSFKNNCALYNISPSGGEATILHPKAVAFCYPSLLRGSDTVFAGYFKKRIPIDNDPTLYIRFFHGFNLWDHEHIMRHLAKAEMSDRFEINPEHKRFLQGILRYYKLWLPMKTKKRR